MTDSSPIVSDERILDAMLLLARAAKPHRIMVAGPSAFDIYLGLLQRGFSRAATPVTCRIACGQHDVALIAGHQTIQALETLLDRIVPFLNTRAALAIWLGPHELERGRRFQAELERLVFRIEARAQCETGFILSARRQQLDHLAKAA